MNTNINMVQFAHVGLHKTATTWLQRSIFPQHPRVLLVGYDTTNSNNASIRREIIRLYGDNQLEWNLDTWKETFSDLLEHYRSSQRLLGISNESLSGNMFTGQNAIQAADRMKVALGRIKIILIVRHPLGYIRSVYAQYVKQGGALRLKSLLTDPNVPGREIYKKLRYKALIEYYYTCFGIQNVLVLPYELLLDDLEAYLRRITDFLELDPFPKDIVEQNQRLYNVGFSPLSLEMMRFANYVGVDKWRSRRYLERLDQKLLNRFHVTPKNVSVEFLLQFEGFKEILKEDEYILWSDELAKYNYTF